MIKRIFILLWIAIGMLAFPACRQTPDADKPPKAPATDMVSSPESSDDVTMTPIQPRTEETNEKPESPKWDELTETEAPAVTSPIESPSANKDDTLMGQVAALVNAERAKAGLSPLTLDAALSQNADVRSREIVRSFSHTRPDGSSAMTAITAPYRTAGENIAAGQRTAEAVMAAWMNSEGHRANILNRAYSKIGVGVTEDGGRLYWVQLFTG